MTYTDKIKKIGSDFSIEGGELAGRRPVHVLLCIHGIRDDGSFATRLHASITRDTERRLNRAGLRRDAYAARVPGSFSDIDFIVVALSTDDRISTLDFLCDARLDASVSSILTQMQQAFERYPDAAFSVLAHSFGTKLLALVLARQQFNLEWIFLCASVAKKSDVKFLTGPPQPMTGRVQSVGGPRLRRVVNDACGRDIVPVVAEMVRSDTYSATGVYGFNRDPVIERCFMHGHANGLKEQHVKKWILAAIAEDQPPRTPYKDWRGWKHLPVYTRRAFLPFIWTGRQLGGLLRLCPKP